MALTNLARAELERRGAPNVARLLQHEGGVGIGQASSVPLGLGIEHNPLRGDVEAWLAERDQATEALAVRRHQEQVNASDRATTWARRAFWAAILIGVPSLLAALAQILVGLH